jgi:hypothetical protein
MRSWTFRGERTDLKHLLFAKNIPKYPFSRGPTTHPPEPQVSTTPPDAAGLPGWGRSQREEVDEFKSDKWIVKGEFGGHGGQLRLSLGQWDYMRKLLVEGTCAFSTIAYIAASH